MPRPSLVNHLSPEAIPMLGELAEEGGRDVDVVEVYVGDGGVATHAHGGVEFVAEHYGDCGRAAFTVNGQAAEGGQQD